MADLTQLNNGALLYYPLDENTGTTAGDSTPNNQDGTITGATWVSGIVGDGLEFNGNANGIAIPLSIGVNGLGAITYSFWTKRISKIGSENIVVHLQQATTLTALNWIAFTTDNKVQVGGRSIGADNFQSVLSTGTYDSTSDWYHIVAVYDFANSEISIFVNGALDKTESVTFGSATADYGSTAAAFTFGRHASATDRGFAGIGDEFAIFNFKPTLAQVQYLYASGSPTTNQQYEFTAPPADPTVTTQAASSIGETTATANGNVTDLGGEAEVQAGHQFRIKNVETPNAWTSTATQERTATGAYTTSLTGLTNDTLYELRSRVTWNAGADEAFGEVVEFTTLEIPAVPPEITTNAATDVAHDAAQLNGNLTTLGDESAVDVSFQYRIKNVETPNAWSQTTPVERVATGTYNTAVSSLTAETVYEFRAVVEWGVDDVDTGSTLEFTTAAEPAVGEPTVTTQAATSVGETTATLNGNLTDIGEESAVDVRFQYRLNGETDWIETTAVERTETGAYTANLTSLTDGVVYQYRAKVEWGVDSEAFGSIVTFETDEIPLPEALVTIQEPTVNQEYRGYGVTFRWTVDTDGQTGDSYLFINQPNNAPIENADYTYAIDEAGVIEQEQEVASVGSNLAGISDNTVFVRFVPDEV